VHEVFTRALAASGVAGSIVDPRGDGLDGVEALAALPVGHIASMMPFSVADGRMAASTLTVSGW
jgi:hypothetical protein